MDHVAAVVAVTPFLGRPVLVAVDGVDGSGKTTFAARLQEGYRARGRAAQVIHLDDFLNPRAIRYRRGPQSPEGYFSDSYDLDGFRRSVLDPLVSVGPGRRIKRRLFDHRSDSPYEDEPVLIPPEAVVVVEGMFLHRDELVAWWDISVFLDVPFSVSVARMAMRDGTNPDPAHPSLARYVEGQRLYLDRCRPMDRATVVVDNTRDD